MKLKVKDLLDSVPALQFLNDVPLPMRLSFRLAQMTRAVDSHLLTYNDVRTKRIQKFHEETKTPEGGEPPIASALEDLHKSLEADIKGLQEEEVELPDISVTVADLESQNIPAKHIVPLWWLVIDSVAQPTA